MSELNPAPGLNEKPGEVIAITVMTLISGITNVVAALTWSFLFVIGTLGIGILCVPVTILPGVLGIFEIIYAANLLSTPPKPVRPSRTLAIFEICMILFLNVISLVTGILALVFYNRPKVQEYYAQLTLQ